MLCPAGLYNGRLRSSRADIGANVGAYTLYAAMRQCVSILAFEPSPASYAALCRNIEVNDSGEQIQAFCIALSGRTQLVALHTGFDELIRAGA